MSNIDSYLNIITLLPALYASIISLITITCLFKMKNLYMQFQSTSILDSSVSILFLISTGLFFLDLTCCIKLVIIQILLIMSSTVSSYMLSSDTYRKNSNNIAE